MNLQNIWKTELIDLQEREKDGISKWKTTTYGRKIG